MARILVSCPTPAAETRDDVLLAQALLPAPFGVGAHVPWVLASLGIPRLSTMFFGGRPARVPESDEESLALLFCLDLRFDRWLRTSAVFGLVFFTSVAFAALNLILPMVTGMDPRIASPLAAVISVASAVPLALRSADGARERVLLRPRPTVP